MFYSGMGMGAPQDFGVQQTREPDLQSDIIKEFGLPGGFFSSIHTRPVAADILVICACFEGLTHFFASLLFILLAAVNTAWAIAE
jgi:hypothetical protein